MREEAFYPNQRHPTFMGLTIKYLFIGCNWFLLANAGAIGLCVHRHCTVRAPELMKNIVLTFRALNWYSPIRIIGAQES